MCIHRPLFLVALVCAVGAAEPDISAERMPRVPATEPERAAATFKLRPGFTAELVAAEPLLTSPVALDVDAQGRAYIVEMRDYSERRPEELGRLKRLEDTDGDGRYDKATIFLSGLPWPTAVTCWDGGVFLGATPDLIYAKDTDGDGVADVRETIFTGFASDYAPYATNKLNVQALLNSFHWGVDNRIHGATSMSGGKVRLVDSEFTRAWLANAAKKWPPTAPTPTAPPPTRGAIDLRGRDFSFDPRTLELRAESGGGQHGMSFDDTGRKFVCSNSDHLQLIAFNELAAPANLFHEFPASRHSIAADGAAAEVFRLSPDEPWRVLRTRWRVTGVVEGMIEGGGRPSGYFTGATGVTIYRGDAYGPDFAGDAFIADCGSNLVHRKRLRRAPDGVLLIGERAADEAKSEFLASTDNWFRPVQFYNAPDGCLWVVDMYRETIEHPWSLPANLKKHLDLDAGRERGRLWRIAPKGFRGQTSNANVAAQAPAAWVNLLAHPNGWQRDTAARLLHEQANPATLPSLRALLRNSPKPLGRLHALRTLASLGGLEEAQLLTALRDANAAVRQHAVQLATARAGTASPAFQNQFTALAATETEPLVQLELALALAALPPAERVKPLAQLIRTGPARVQSAALHSAGGIEAALWQELRPSPSQPTGTNLGTALPELAQSIGRRGEPAAIRTVTATLAPPTSQASDQAITEALARGLAHQGHSLAGLDRDSTAILTAAWQRATQRPAPVKRPPPVPLDTNRLAVIAHFLPALDLPGDAARGATLFRARCATCHAFRGDGATLGPDLASVTANGPEKLLVSILDPNREVAPNFRAWSAETKDGETFSGLLVRETDSTVTLKLAGGLDKSLPRSRLATLKEEAHSLMPEGLEAGLSPADLAHLLAWLLGHQ
jgi:putative membrane-bound dehydrogenase-like protein